MLKSANNNSHYFEIDNEFRGRTGQLGKQHIPASVEERFSAGDFVYAALNGNPDQWQYHAAMGMAGKFSESLEGLSRFKSPEVEFYRGVVNWLAGEDAEALNSLKKVKDSSEHARNLISLIAKPTIKVLSQLPSHWEKVPLPTEKFEILNLERGALIGDKFPSLFAEQPDFYASIPLEWHHFPKDYEFLECPIIGFSSDYDSHLQMVAHWFPIFDEIIVNSPSQWSEMLLMTRKIPSSFVKMYGLDHNLPHLNRGRREMEIFMSGFIIHPLNPDKVINLLEALKIDKHKMTVQLGFSTDYLKTLNNAKASWTYVRFPGGISTRGIESLAMGCSLAVQKGAAIGLYVPDGEGILYYDRPEDLVPTLSRLIEKSDHFTPKALKSAEIIRDQFRLSRVISESFRFMAYLAAKPRPEIKRKKLHYEPHKQLMFMKGTPDNATIRETRTTQSILTLVEEASTATWPHKILDCINSVALDYAAVNYQPSLRRTKDLAHNPDYFNIARDYYKLAADRFINSIVIRFNHLRFAAHFGKPDDVTDALKLGVEILSKPQDWWQADPLEDVFPFDFMSDYFNYRKYLDACTENLITTTPAREKLVRLIYASVHLYMGHYNDPLYHFEQAVKLDEDMPYYKFKLAQALISSNVPQNIKNGGDILVELCKDTYLFRRSFKTLKKVIEEFDYSNPEICNIAKIIEKFENDLTEMENENLELVTLQEASFIPHQLLNLCQGTKYATKLFR